MTLGIDSYRDALPSIPTGGVESVGGARPEIEKTGECPGYGASKAEWAHFDEVLGLTADLLPVVSNPSVKTSAASTISNGNRGKVPSQIRQGTVGGIKEWTNKRSTHDEVNAWSGNPDYGICVQTRGVRAIDIDIDDRKRSQSVVQVIELLCGHMPKRSRSNSGKCLLLFRMPGTLQKQRFATGNGEAIELLGDGQQFVAVGTHPSGASYEWEGGLPSAIPALDRDEVTSLWDVLCQSYAVESEKTVKDPTPRVERENPDDLDRAKTLRQVDDDTMADVRSALQVFTAEDCDDYDFWVPTLGLALKSLAQAGRETEALEMWHEVSAKSPRYEHEEAQAKWETFTPDRITYKTIFAQAEARGWINPRSTAGRSTNATADTRVDRTDAGNVTLLATQVDGNLRFIPESRTWVWWCGERWTQDTYGTAAQNAALQVAEHYHRRAVEMRRQAAANSLDDKERKRIELVAVSLEKWAAHCRNKKAVDCMLSMAKSDQRFTLAVGELDRDPWLFGVNNGVVDLRTGQWREACRDDYVTKRSPVAFNPDATAPRWLQFIEEITAKPTGALGTYKPRPLLVAYLQRALGYAMTGSTREQKMFIAIGEGSNGKNVLLDLLQEILGDYCQTIPPEALMATRHDADAERPSPTAATLAGARAAISSESKDGQCLNVALVKRHTGGGYMTARYMRENTFCFEITHKLWLMTNHTPALDRMDEAMRGRLHLIPFDRQWNRPGNPERDPNLPDGDKDLQGKLRQEAEGILAWLIKGAVAYASEGLEPPSEVANMTREFFKDQDPFRRWLDTCIRCDAKSGARAAQLFEVFNQWREAEGEESGPKSQKAFSTALATHGVDKHTDSGGVRYALHLPQPGSAN